LTSTIWQDKAAKGNAMSSRSIPVRSGSQRRTLRLLLIVLALLAALPLAVWLDLRDLTQRMSQQQAYDTGEMISDIRGFYAKEVVGRILAGEAKGDPTTVVANYHDVSGAVPIPATFSIAIGNLVSGRDSAVRYDFVSDFPFAHRAPYELTPFQKQALAAFRADPTLVNTETHSGGMFDPVVQVAFPIRMTEACVACHDNHPDSPKKDWKVGDVRGIQAVTIAHPIVMSLWSFKYLLIYFAFAAASGIAIVLMQRRQARQISAMNKELSAANDFLASISMKISKYLSPQIYKSIFSGRRDVKITTERKKLTIFFSDIKDFTATAEHMQPEEFTALLNEYLTEMSTIALAHGATLDKFIGDAILAFFGDPETRGVAEDARACINMAIAMQQRLKQLNVIWRARGIDTPFETRMGINTGYCNVGNFGSEDRMAYTIVGAEANLAARLQASADPGGIVVSCETYSLVKDLIRARRLEPITMKGIPLPVVPYAVEMSTATDASVIDTQIDGLVLRLDLNDVDQERAARLRARLLDAVAAITAKVNDTSSDTGAFAVPEGVS
jgi:adenylate cyclase